ncbi:hypothetical protein [Mycobacterium intracellulare]|uniref:hypothetical protein n=1 Tax=Mycobacterium intracellulare TaxID=1767 RepID=UPI0006CA9DC6|nr:hypothetical protein [Mycobacterium intracellulare]KPN45973.1 hypothetical protein AN933_26825 [Mycobacterium intracellulare subsp. chimaera]
MAALAAGYQFLLAHRPRTSSMVRPGTGEAAAQLVPTPQNRRIARSAATDIASALSRRQISRTVMPADCLFASYGGVR